MSLARTTFASLALAVVTACGSNSPGSAPAVSAGGGGTNGAGVGGGSAGPGGNSATGGGTAAAGTSAAGGASAAGSSAGGGGGNPPNEKTFTFTMDTFTVEAGQEVYRCQNFANPFGDDIEVTKFESHMASGSHHLLMYYMGPDPKTGPLQDGPLTPCSGLEFHASPYGTQLPDDFVQYPPGIAALAKKTDGFRFQSHYLNTTNAPITASVVTTFHIAEPGTITDHAGVLFMVQPNFAIKPHTTQVVTRNCKVPRDMNLLLASSHMHQHGTHFDGNVGGNLVYTTNTWDNPKPKIFSPEVVAKQGDPISFSCTFQNDSDKTLTFGESALINEMCIFSAQYYPLPLGADATIDCSPLRRDECWVSRRHEGRRGEEDERDPHRVRDEEVQQLEGDWREHREIDEAERNLCREEGAGDDRESTNGRAGAACGDEASGEEHPAADREPDERVINPELDQKVRGRDEVLRDAFAQTPGRKERVAEGGDRARGAEEQSARERRARREARRSAPAEARARSTGSPPRRERHRRDEEERVDEVRRDDERAERGLVRCDELEADEDGADQPLRQHQHHRHDGGGSHRIALRERAERPYELDEDEETRRRRCDPVRKLDERLARSRVGNDLAVAGRPMTAATRARSARPHVGAPDDHERERAEDEPGESSEAVQLRQGCAFRTTVVVGHDRGGFQPVFFRAEVG